MSDFIEQGRAKFMAINHASVVPGGHSRVSPSGNAPATQRRSATIAVSKGNHPTFSWNTKDPYDWKGWIYETTK